MKKLIIATIMMLGFGITCHADELPVMRQGDITYVTGGIGDDEMEALERVKHEYNVAITISDKTGAYLADSHIVIKNATGATVLDAEYTGPILYALIPAGSYEIAVTNGDKVIRKKSIIKSAASNKLHFTL